MAKLNAGNKTIECRLVIFDKNGTLVDQYSLLLELARARKNSVHKYVGEKATDLWEKIVGVDVENGHIDQSGPLATVPRREEISIAAAAFYLSGSPWSEAKQTAAKAYDEADHMMMSPYDSVLLEGIKEALKQLKQHGLKLAIASTDTHKRTEESFKVLKIVNLFDAIIGSDDITEGKPSPDMVFEILRKTESKADEAVMVGDSMSDMQMGKNAKVKACIGVLTGFTPREKLEQLADIVVASAAELSAV